VFSEGECSNAKIMAKKRQKKPRDVKAVKLLRKRKHFQERSWKRKRTPKHLTFRAGSESAFHKRTGMWKQKLKAVEAVKFLWKQSRAL